MVSRRIRFALLAAASLVSALSFTGTALAVSPNVVISQVYGGGGNTGALFQNDYVELFNRSLSTVSLDGMSIQYASAAEPAISGLTGQRHPLRLDWPRTVRSRSEGSGRGKRRCTLAGHHRRHRDHDSANAREGRTRHRD